VDVEFDLPADATSKTLPKDLRYEIEMPVDDSDGNPKRDYRFVPNDELKIRRISRPYFEQEDYD
jgi:hypothetical protein